jgi:hypothetical protein
MLGLFEIIGRTLACDRAFSFDKSRAQICDERTVLYALQDERSQRTVARALDLWRVLVVPNAVEASRAINAGRVFEPRLPHLVRAVADNEDDPKSVDDQTP